MRRSSRSVKNGRSPALQREQVVPGVGADERLLPRVARQLDAVQPADRLHEAGAVGAPRREAAPLVCGALEAERAVGERGAAAREARRARRRARRARRETTDCASNSSAPNGRCRRRSPAWARHPSDTRGTAPPKAARSASARVGVRRRREGAIRVRSERLRVVRQRRHVDPGQVARVRPPLVAVVQRPYAVPLADMLDGQDHVAEERLGDLAARHAGLGVQRRDGRADEGDGRHGREGEASAARSTRAVARPASRLMARRPDRSRRRRRRRRRPVRSAAARRRTSRPVRARSPRVSVPPWSRTMPDDTASPSPVPCPTGFVV